MYAEVPENSIERRSNVIFLNLDGFLRAGILQIFRVD